ncbi:hypothetical protein HF324_18435 [Chitinophaga oryzae]|uniref:Uncharacterized protein n=1 Tax=Chitinophaga oryzae TaxID=2725414 RepID=A0ABX6LIP0_9BACT|nr:hypothetical protein [Chitinophaga oryzae]QJB39727.1 hypothetical protein HF324_18435 [Chitinophaga oryzae]
MSNIIEVQLGGALRTLRFNNWQKEALGSILGKDPLVAGKTLAKKAKESPLDALCDLVYTGLVGNYRIQRKNLDFTPSRWRSGWGMPISTNSVPSLLCGWILPACGSSFLPNRKRRQSRERRNHVKKK